jgi:hypothetical protein
MAEEKCSHCSVYKASCDGTGNVRHVRMNVGGEYVPASPSTLPCPELHANRYPLKEYRTAGGRDEKNTLLRMLIPEYITDAGLTLVEAPAEPEKKKAKAASTKIVEDKPSPEDDPSIGIVHNG